jgi:hypothetical protein
MLTFAAYAEVSRLHRSSAGSLMPGKTRAPRRRGCCSFIPRPGRAGEFFEESQRLQRSYESFASEDVTAAYRRHRWEIVGPPPF